MRPINFIGYKPLLLIVMSLLPILCGCAGGGNIQKTSVASAALPVWIKHSLGNIPTESEQIIIVLGEKTPSVYVHVYALERQKSEWVQLLQPIEAIIGSKGFAGPGTKREGDGKTPTGIFPLEFVFGYDEKVNTRMTYRQATETDIWVDDAQSDDYNRWVKKTETRATSFEEMKRSDDLYKYGIVVGYNTQPIIKGNGSAIFLHIGAGNNVPTSGCVAMAEEDLLGIIGWLDSAQKPLILMGYEESLRRLN
jgi:L,D-peptidoglycan transpeptidase YkuD (ErfK/YbiS/YcfS/YnhG family)